MKLSKYKFTLTYMILDIIFLYVLIWQFIMLESDDIYTLHFIFDVNPYYHQILSDALDHKGRNNFKLVLSF